MSNIYILSDAVILAKIGGRIKNMRLAQNITQESLAKAAKISLSSIKKIEIGEIKSFDSLLRVLRILGKLDIFQSLIEDEPMSPSEYYEFINSSNKKKRKRAVGKINNRNKEESEW